MGKAKTHSLWVSVKASTAGFNKGMKRARMSLKGFVKAIPGAKILLGGLGAALSVGGFAYFVKGAMKGIDATSKFAARIGITVEAMQSLQHAAELTGVGVSSLQMGLQRMVRRTAEAARGTGEAVNAYKELGLNARELVKMPVDKMFYRVADAMMRVTNQSDRVRLTMKLADSEGVALVNTFALGAEGLQAINDELMKSGLLWSKFDAGRVESANDAMSKLKLTVQKVWEAIAIGLAPWIEIVTEKLKDWITGSGDIGEKVRGVIETVALMLAGMADALTDGLRDMRMQFGKFLVALPEKLGVTSIGHEMITAAMKMPQGNLRGDLESRFQIEKYMRERAASGEGASKGLGPATTHRKVAGGIGITEISPDFRTIRAQEKQALLEKAMLEEQRAGNEWLRQISRSIANFGSAQ